MGRITKTIQPKHRETLVSFLSSKGRAFYKQGPQQEASGQIVLQRKNEKVPNVIQSADGNTKVIPFRHGEDTLSLSWK